MRARPGAMICFLVAGVLAAGEVGAMPPVGIEKRTKITIRIQPMTAAFATDQEALHATLVLDTDAAEQSRLALAWPATDEVSTLFVRAAKQTPPAGDANCVRIDARLVLPDESVVNADRTVSFGDDATALFEVYRFGQKSLTLALSFEATSEMVVSAKRSPGAQVRFRLEVVRVLEGREVSLEQNFLNTLVGEPVSYSFRLAETPDADAVSITLRPTRLHADIAEIDVDVSGKLPVGDELTVISRTEHWLASRGAVSSLAFEAGEPPSGYRFLVTARF